MLRLLFLVFSQWDLWPFLAEKNLMIIIVHKISKQWWLSSIASSGVSLLWVRSSKEEAACDCNKYVTFLETLPWGSYWSWWLGKGCWATTLQHTTRGQQTAQHVYHSCLHQQNNQVTNLTGESFYAVTLSHYSQFIKPPFMQMLLLWFHASFSTARQ